MKDIKVIDTLKKLQSDEEWWAGRHSPIEFFAEAVAITREERGGVSIKDIARCFKAQFAEEEMVALINELNKPNENTFKR